MNNKYKLEITFECLKKEHEDEMKAAFDEMITKLKDNPEIIVHNAQLNEVKDT